ncbi:MAG: AbrB/MazE/SpoVT family DNA-binding domain-containing protein [Clostridiaceae bacterium]|jgi:AbrB family looped-hinge helix DNA binding protein|nr:AbrB/MazE/SpoVT family DNA-binding domain-containing protein [Clostridiaceae bacterium]
MELAKITSKGQITVPKEIRDKLKLKTGDKVIFIEEGDKIIFANSSIIALKEIQKSMEGKAEISGIKSEEDINKLVHEVREELWEKRYADNDFG